MKKLAALALSSILILSLFAGCRRNVGNETTAPATTAPTSSTGSTTQTTPTTRPATQPATNNTESSTVIPDGSGTTDGTNGMDRGRGMPRR